MIDTAEPISIRRQCALAGVSRNRRYRKPSEISVEDLNIMERMDKLHTEDPSAGARRLAAYLMRDGFGSLSRKRVRRLMRQMAMEAVYPRPRTTIANGKAARHPYLLRNLKIERPNQVWCADITYIPMSIVSGWKKELQERMGEVFEKPKKSDRTKDKRESERLQRKIGQLTMDIDWLKKKCEELQIPIDELR